MRGAASRFADSTHGARKGRFAHRVLMAMFACALALTIAPAADASYGIIGQYGFTRPFYEAVDAPGEFINLDSVGVNSAGTGGANPGEIYIQDAGGTTCCGGHGPWGGRVQQFSVGGSFRRLWGLDVVAAGPGNADETQALRIVATGGSFTVTFGGQTTGPIAFNASDTVVKSALDGLGSIGGVGGSVSVAGGPGDAAGTSPYLITFGGTMGGADQPSMSPDGSALTGGGTSASVVTTNPGAKGFEICEPAVGDACKTAIKGSGTGRPENFVGGALGEPTTLSVDQADGSVYSLGFNRISKFSASGSFLRAWGADAVRSGPDDSAANEQQQVTVAANGGSFTLSLYEGEHLQTTSPIAYDASPAEVKSALDALESVGGAGGSVSVTGGPGDAIGSSPYVITFGGAMAGDNVNELFAGTAELAAPKLATVSTISNGGAFEVCAPSDLCKAGDAASSIGGAVSASTSIFSIQTGQLSVASPGTVNQGNVLYPDPQSRRVTEFTSTGGFVRTFGWDVVSSGPDDGSVSETQNVTLGANTTGGRFSLSFDGATTGATGIGNRVAGSNQLTNVVTTNGSFAVGEVITGNGIPSSPPTEITAVGTGTLSMSANATSSGSAGELTGGDIAYNASAAEVEASLNSLPTIAGPGGSVAVSGGPGPGTPYEVSFAGNLAGDDVDQLASSASGLEVSSGSGSASVATVSNGGSFEVCTPASTCKVGVAGSALGQFSNVTGVAEDSTGAIYTSEGPEQGFRVQKFSSPALTPSAFGAPEAPTGTSNSTSPVGVGVGPGDEVYVPRRTPAGFTTCSTGSPSPFEERIQIFPSSGASLNDVSTPCGGIPGTESFGGPQEFDLMNDTGVGYLTTTSYALGFEYNVLVLGQQGTAPELSVDPPSNVSATGATVSGTVDPNGPGAVPYPHPALTKYRVEYRKVGEPTWQVFAPDVTVGGSYTPIPFSVGVSGLTPKTEYEARVTVTKPGGFDAVVATVAPFTTLAAPPLIGAFWSSNVTPHSADLHALINPLGTDTTYHFDYGKTPDYGSSTVEAGAGDGPSAVKVDAHVEGLEPTVYHFRVVATNSEGTVSTTDQTFNFYPEPCPNETVRQQTGSGSLPDCRAYELVTPGDSATAFIHSGGPSPSFASNPPRLAFKASIGTIPGPWNVPSGLTANQYIATRTTSGWRTSYVGFSADVAVDGTGWRTGQFDVRPGNRALSEILEWRGEPHSEIAAYRWDAEGHSLGQLPTNLSELGLPDEQASAGGPYGKTLASPDLDHYFIASPNTAFAPGGLTSGAGSVYDNDVPAETVDIASKLPGGAATFRPSRA